MKCLLHICGWKILKKKTSANIAGRLYFKIAFLHPHENAENHLFNAHFFSLDLCFHIKDQIIGVFCFQVFSLQIVRLFWHTVLTPL